MAITSLFILLLGVVLAGTSSWWERLGPSRLYRPTGQSAVLAETTMTSPFAYLTEEQRICIRGVLGEARYVEVDTGIASLTDSEHRAINQACFSTPLPTPLPTPTPTPLLPFLVSPEPSYLPSSVTPHPTLPSRILPPSPLPGTSIAPHPRPSEPRRRHLRRPPPTTETPASPTLTPQREHREHPRPLLRGVRFTPGGVSEPVLACLREALGADFDWLNDLRNPAATGEYDRFHSLMGRVATCRHVATPAPEEPRTLLRDRDREAPPAAVRPEELRVHQVDADTLTCLRNAVSPERFSTITEGRYRPTPEEAAQARGCYASLPTEGAPVNTITTSVGALPAAADACLKNALGEERAGVISRGEGTAALEEITRARGCFGILEAPLAPPPVVRLPEPVRECLALVVGPETLARLARGEEATATTRLRSQACFADLPPVEAALLPLPPERVPLLPLAPTELLTVPTAKTIVEEITEKHTTIPRIVLEGRAPPGTVVELYLYSSAPIVVTLTTDENGVWRYTLDQPLAEGEHRAYTVVKLAGREPVRSAAFEFAVARAAPPGAREAGLIVAGTDTPAPSRTYLRLSVLVVTISTLAALGLYAFRARRWQQPSTPSFP